MKRFVSVWLPDWPIERLRRDEPSSVPADRPLALVHAGPHGLAITAANASARAAGLGPGLSLADARAMYAGFLTRPAEPARDATALVGLAHWCARYGPSRNIDFDSAQATLRDTSGPVEAGTHGLWIDITGVAHLFGGEAALLGDLTARLARLGITARSGLADTAAAAFALARYATDRTQPFAIAGAGETGVALAGLPVAALRLAPQTIALLHRLGLRRIGQLYDLPRAALARRLRPVGRSRAPGRRKSSWSHDAQAEAVLLRLDQALGLALEPRAGLPEPADHAARKLFCVPLATAEAISAAIADLAALLCAALASAGLGARRFRLTLCRTDGSHAGAEIGTSRLCRDPGHIGRLFAERLGAIDAGFGIEAAVLGAGGVHPFCPSQIALGAATGSGPCSDVADLIDRLSNRLGEGAVLRLGVCASHVPERVAIRLPALEAGSSKQVPDPPPGSMEVPPLPPRPLFLLPSPEPIAAIAEIPDGPPLHFTWRRVRRRVVASEGPERIAPEWWRTHTGPGPHAAAAPGIGRTRAGQKLPRTRDYYRVEDTEGTRYWVFRDGLFGDDEGVASPPAWFMHGLFA